MPENDKKKEKSKDVQKMDSMVKLRTLIKDTETIKKFYIDDSHLEKYLYGVDFDVEAALKKMKSHYELMLEYPSWFPTEGPIQKKSVIDKDIRMIIPQEDKEGRIIYIMKLGNLDMNTMKLFDVVAVDDIWLESLLASNPQITQKGLCVIIDVANYSWKMLKWVTPENIKLSVKKILNLPFKDLRIHIVNKSMVMQVAIKIAWPMLPQSLRDTIKFHFDDWDSLYEHIQKEVLPPEYGGFYDVDYNELYKKLYQKNEEILKVLKLYRDITFT